MPAHRPRDSARNSFGAWRCAKAPRSAIQPRCCPQTDTSCLFPSVLSSASSARRYRARMRILENLAPAKVHATQHHGQPQHQPDSDKKQPPFADGNEGDRDAGDRGGRLNQPANQRHQLHGGIAEGEGLVREWGLLEWSNVLSMGKNLRDIRCLRVNLGLCRQGSFAGCRYGQGSGNGAADAL